MLSLRCITLLAILVLCTESAIAKGSKEVDKDNTLQVQEEQITSLLRKTPMPELGEGRLAKILTRYYLEGLRGPEHWDKISSIRVWGTLKLEDGTFHMDAYQKKPDLIKMTISNKSRELTLAYDGETAWQHVPGDENPKQMEPGEARRFKHTARFGNHLLYPFAEGKKITYIDTVPVEGNISHQIRVDLDNGYQVDYFIDIRTYLEIKVVNHDLETGTKNTIVYTDYIREFGVPIAKNVESYENGEWVSSLTIDQVKVNSGIIPWMFKMRVN